MDRQPERSSSGLLLVMTDIPAELDAEFNSWYDTEHVPERLAIPGFVSARRYRAVTGSPRYLALYELESPDVVETPAYRYWIEEGETPWTRRMQQHFVDYTRNVYAELPQPDRRRA